MKITNGIIRFTVLTFGVGGLIGGLVQASIHRPSTFTHLRSLNPPAVQIERIHPESPVEIRLRLASGWKINPKAPSSLSLFEESLGKNESPVSSKLIRKFVQAEISRLKLGLLPLKSLHSHGPLTSSTQYRLKGTFYICRDGKGGACRMENKNLLLVAYSDGNGVRTESIEFVLGQDH